MCVVAIYRRVTGVAAHMFVPSSNKHKHLCVGCAVFQKAIGTCLISFIAISELLFCLCYKIAFIYFPAFTLADLYTDTEA